MTLGPEYISHNAKGECLYLDTPCCFEAYVMDGGDIKYSTS